MNKTLLKRLLYELLEDMVLLEAQIDQLDEVISANLLPYLRVLNDRLQHIKTSLDAHRAGFLQFYQENALDEAWAETFVQQVLPEFRAQLEPISKALYRLKSGQILPETELYLNNLQLNKLLPDIPPMIVLPTQNQAEQDPPELTQSFLASYLPFLSIEAPLRWIGLLDGFSGYFSEKTLQIQSLLESVRIPAENKQEMIVPLLSLRLLGPCYYAYYVLNAFAQKDATALWVVEPILFQELNRFGLVNKDLVILHQSLEKGRQQLGCEEPKSLLRVLGNDEIRDEILKVVEKVIPERLAFTEKSLVRAQLLEERLEHGVLIGAVPMLSSPAQLREDLSHLDETVGVYPLLQQLQESPATPREIINAGWLHKLDHSPGWLFNLFGEEAADNWDCFKQNVLILNTVLLKSIEISEVHRVLSQEHTEHLVSV